MPLGNYTELQAEIVNHAWRGEDDEFLAALPTLITGAESLLNYGYGVPGEPDAIPPLRTAEMETQATLTLASGEANLPADFLDVRRVSATADRTPLKQITPEQAEDIYGANAAGSPKHFTLIGGKIKVYPSLSGDIRFLYYAKIPALSNTVTTNWLLAKQPLAYLYGGLMLGEPFMRDDSRLMVWGRMFRGVVAGLNRSANFAKYGDIAVRVKGPTP